MNWEMIEEIVRFVLCLAVGFMIGYCLRKITAGKVG